MTFADEIWQHEEKTVTQRFLFFQAQCRPNAGQSSLDDLQYVEDLGLIQLYPRQQISNRIYQEVIPRELTYPTQLGSGVVKV